MTLFDYKSEEAIGTVYSVDTGTVIVTVSDVEHLRSLQVNRLVVLRSSKAGQHLIGLINKITRKALAESIDEDSGEDVPEDITVVENIIRVVLIGTLLDMVGTTPNVFRRTLETVPEIDANCFVLEGERLTKFMQSISKSLQEGKQPLSLGTYTIDEDAEAWIDGNKFFQRHAVVVGSTGSGKSWSVARILEQVAELPNANAILFDIHGEYAPMRSDGIQHLRVAGPGDLDGSKNLDDGIVFLPYWLLTYEEMLALLLDRSDQNAPNQAMVFSREVTSAKRSKLEEEGKAEVLANFTVDSPVPYSLDTIMDRLIYLNEERVEGAKKGTTKAGDFNSKLSRFIQRLDAKRKDRRLTFLFGDPEHCMNYEWMPTLCTRLLGSTGQQDKGGVKIIDFSEVPSDILPLIIGLVARVVFSVQQWTLKENRHPIALVCDEAHLYIPARTEASAVNEAAVNNFERIAKEGRKYGVGLVVVSQRPAEVSRTVLSQCNNYVAMRLTNAEDQAVVRRLLPDSLGGFSDLLPILDIGEALVVGDCSMLPSRIRIEEPKTKPASATIEFWDEWSKDKASEGIADAVEYMRRQSKS
ncbi:MAG: ATP-binding protein [Deltaproteobacteria bacterium]|nr:ATP-binding protein [Deltaproteobacteria bacterium]MCD6580162.1 ATP-binding protein [Desulfuromusa sp.]